MKRSVESSPDGALIAVVGDNNNDLFTSGMKESSSRTDGALFLGVNEGNLNDNTVHLR